MREAMDSDDDDLPMGSALDDGIRGLDNYEALINLDENVVRPVPRQLLALLPVAEFT
jgi:hypothetical protein